VIAVEAAIAVLAGLAVYVYRKRIVALMGGVH
jgi:POT family proton-dependent oligopeptide transporter